MSENNEKTDTEARGVFKVMVVGTPPYYVAAFSFQEAEAAVAERVNPHVISSIEKLPGSILIAKQGQ